MIRHDSLRRDGFSLLELMITMGILSIIAVYLMETFTVSNRNYSALEQTVEAQQTMRAIADLMERDVRHAGMMVPEASAACGVDSTTGADLLYVSDHEAVEPNDDIVSYEGIQISGAVTGVSGSVTLTLDSLMVEPTAPNRPAYDSNADGTDDSDFQIGGGFIVSDRDNPARGAVCGRVTAINIAGTQVSVVATSGNLGSVGSGTPDLVIVPAIEYRLDNQNVLRRNGVALAKDVEDLQVAYFFDLNDDSLIASSEGRGTPGGTAYTSGSLNVETLREIRINFVTRTRLEDSRFPTGVFKSMENRAAVSGNDGYHRRVHTSTIMPRNLVNRMNVS